MDEKLISKILSVADELQIRGAVHLRKLAHGLSDDELLKDKKQKVMLRRKSRCLLKQVENLLARIVEVNSKLLKEVESDKREFLSDNPGLHIIQNALVEEVEE